MKLIKFFSKVNKGSEENPVYENGEECTKTVYDVFLDDNLSIAKAEAYNGEVTVEDVPDVPQEPTTESDMLETVLDHEIRLSELELLGGNA